MHKFFNKILNFKGFTQVEILLTIGLSALLLSIITINLSGSQKKATLSSETNKFIADIKDQQIRAMTGDSAGIGNNSDYGVYVEPTKYTLFRGSVYNPVDSSNFEIELPQTIVFTNVGTQIIFEKGSGQISGSAVVTLQNTLSSEQDEISINKYGIVTEVN